MTDQNGQLPATRQQGGRPSLTAGAARPAAIVPTTIEETFRLAGAIVAADMAPKSYGRDQNKVMIGIMHGMEVGFTPMAALQSIAVINGMPGLYGDGALAVVLNSGLCEDYEEYLEENDTVGYCMMRRKGRSKPIEQRFSVDDAKKAGLWGKAGPWTQYPKRMLKMRARSWCLRDGFADVIRGLHIVEEIQDMGRLEAEADGTYRAGSPPPRPVRSYGAEQQALPSRPVDHREPEIIDQEISDEPEGDAAAAEGPRFWLHDEEGGQMSEYAAADWPAAWARYIDENEVPADVGLAFATANASTMAEVEKAGFDCSGVRACIEAMEKNLKAQEARRQKAEQEKAQEPASAPEAAKPEAAAAEGQEAQAPAEAQQQPAGKPVRDAAGGIVGHATTARRWIGMVQNQVATAKNENEKVLIVENNRFVADELVEGARAQNNGTIPDLWKQVLTDAGMED